MWSAKIILFESKVKILAIFSEKSHKFLIFRFGDYGDTAREALPGFLREET